MTQSPRSGEAAPSDTSVPADQSSTAAYAPPNQSEPGQSGPQSAPSQSTPWSATSRAPGTAPSLSTPAGSPPSGSANRGAAPDTPTDSVPAVKASGTSTAGGARGRAARARGPRRARLQLRHINPWTVLKFSCVLAIALFFVWLIVVGVLYGVLDASGVVGKINNAYTTLKGDGAKAPVTATLVFGSAAIIGVVNIILFIALSTVGSVIYNLCADLVGGVEVTLSER